MIGFTRETMPTHGILIALGLFLDEPNEELFVWFVYLCGERIVLGLRLEREADVSSRMRTWSRWAIHDDREKLIYYDWFGDRRLISGVLPEVFLSIFEKSMPNVKLIKYDFL